MKKSLGISAQAAIIITLFTVFLSAGCASGAGQAVAATKGGAGASSLAPSATGERIAQAMLMSDGRTIQTEGGRITNTQPEKGFTLSVPDEIWAGEPFIFRVGGEGLKKITVSWRNTTFTVNSFTSEGIPMCEAALSVPLDAKEKGYTLAVALEWENRTEAMRATIPVQHRKYPVQSLKVAPKYVTPPPEVEEKIKRDRASLAAVLKVIRPEKDWALPLLRPAPGEITSVFGLRRVFNKQPKGHHRGIDFDALAGDSIASAEAGIVVLAEEQYYGGNMVVVDHGLGVFTMYLHMSAFNTTVGKRVARGDTLGFVGSTGRSTGPHLHFSMSVLRESVNAAPFIAGMENK